MTSRTANRPGNEADRDSPRPGLMAWLEWGIICVIGLSVLSLSAARVPPRLRLLGLFAIAFGALCGWGMRRLAGTFQLPRRWPAVLTTGFLVAAALVGQTLETWRLFQQEEARQFDEAVKETRRLPQMPLRGVPTPGGEDSSGQPKQGRSADNETTNTKKQQTPSKQTPSKQTPSPKGKTGKNGNAVPLVPQQPDSREDMLAKGRKIWLRDRASFSAYLRHRVRELGEWSVFWAAAFWGAELTAGVLCAVWVFRRS